MSLPSWYSNALGAGHAVSQREVLFVMGCQKSGTTWVQMLLDAHPQVCCGGEGHLGNMVGPLVEGAIKAYNDAPRTTISVGGAQTFSLVRLFADQILASYLATSPNPDAVRIVGDKTPESALAVGPLDKMYPGARFIQIIRDGRDAAVSGWAHLQRQGTAGKFATFADYAAYFAEYHWVAYITRARQAAEQLGDRYIEVRYEILHDEPHAHTRRLFEFLGVDSTDDAVGKCVEAASFSKATRGRRPGDEDPSSHFRKGIVGDWVNHFDADCLARFESVAGDLLGELGYVTESRGEPAQPVTSTS